MPDKPQPLSERMKLNRYGWPEEVRTLEDRVAELEKDRARLRKELIYAAMSLHGYEQSCGTGSGSDEARDIAMQLGYEGGSDHDLTRFLVAAMAAEEGR